MKKENFKNLLIDLYKIYNPSYIKYVDELVEKYNRIEFDALRNIFLKYNTKSSNNYNEKFNNVEYVLSLIKEYDSGKRLFENFEPVKIGEENLEEKSQKKIEQAKSIREEIDAYLNEKTSENKKVKIFLTDINDEINIPNKELIVSLGKGARIITTIADDKKTFALEIIDVIFDNISDPKIPLIEIFLKKV